MYLDAQLLGYFYIGWQSVVPSVWAGELGKVKWKWSLHVLWGVDILISGSIRTSWKLFFSAEWKLITRGWKGLKPSERSYFPFGLPVRPDNRIYFTYIICICHRLYLCILKLELYSAGRQRENGWKFVALVAEALPGLCTFDSFVAMHQKIDGLGPIVLHIFYIMVLKWRP